MKENIIINAVNTYLTHRPGTVLIGMQDALIDGFYLDTTAYNFFKDPLAIHNISPTTTPYSNTYASGFMYGVNEAFGQNMFNTTMDITPNYNKFLIDSSSQINSNNNYENNLSYHYISDIAGIATFSHKYNRYLDGIYKTTNIPNIFLRHEEGEITYVSNNNKIVSFNAVTLATVREIALVGAGYSRMSILSYDYEKIKYINYTVLNNNDTFKYEILEMDLKSFATSIKSQGQYNKMRYRFDPNGYLSNKYDTMSETLLAYPVLDDNSRGAHLFRYIESIDRFELIDDCLEDLIETNITNNRCMLRIVNGQILILRHYIATENQNTPAYSVLQINMMAPVRSKVTLMNHLTLNELGSSIQSHKSIHVLDAIGSNIAIYSDASKTFTFLKYNNLLYKYVLLRTESNARSIFLDRQNNKLISYKSNNSIRLAVYNNILRQIYIEYPDTYVKYEGVNIPIQVQVYVLRNAEFENKRIRLQITQGGQFGPGVYEREINTSDVGKTSVSVTITSAQNLQINTEFV